jgi:hypothetical protein
MFPPIHGSLRDGGACGREGEIEGFVNTVMRKSR